MLQFYLSLFYFQQPCTFLFVSLIYLCWEKDFRRTPECQDVDWAKSNSIFAFFSVHQRKFYTVRCWLGLVYVPDKYFTKKNVKDVHHIWESSS